MKIYTFETKQIVPISLDEAWDFFSNPANLSRITPPEMGFEVLTKLPDKVYAGMIIKYYVRPLFNIKMNWVTEITQVNAPKFFIDEQRFGPYKFWHHQHHFREHPEGVEMVDIVNYGLPFGIFGTLAKPIIVEKKLKQIFDYRKTILEKMFPIIIT